MPSILGGFGAGASFLTVFRQKLFEFQISTQNRRDRSRIY